MTTPYRPHFQIEGPATACVIHDHDLGWQNCTPLSGGMALDASTSGHIVISGCQIRDETGDDIGGVTLPQVAAVIESHGVHVDVHVGAGVCTPQYAAVQLRARRPIILQGNTLPDGRGNVNHAVEVNDVWGGTRLDTPAYAMVFDPWSTGPAAWPWWKVLTFASALHPWGETDPRTLGPGKFYAGILPAQAIPDTHVVHLAPNARIRSYQLGTAGCISSWVDTHWINRASGALCEAPVHRVTCDGRSAASTVKVTSGAYAGHHIQVNPPSVTVS
jgi:hypothetical protein